MKVKFALQLLSSSVEHCNKEFQESEAVVEFIRNFDILNSRSLCQKYFKNARTETEIMQRLNEQLHIKFTYTVAY